MKVGTGDECQKCGARAADDEQVDAIMTHDTVYSQTSGKRGYKAQIGYEAQTRQTFGLKSAIRNIWTTINIAHISGLK